MLDSIKEGDFVLITDKKINNEYMYLYVVSINKHLNEIIGTVLKTNLSGTYSRFPTYRFSLKNYILSKIIDNKV